MASSNKPFPFFNLPGEIRNRIYEYLVDPCNPYHHQYRSHQPKSHHMPLMLSCRQLYYEYSSFVWRNAIFNFRKYKDLRRFTRLTVYRSQRHFKLPSPAHLELNFSPFDLFMFSTEVSQRSLRPSPDAHASKLFNPCLVGALETLTISIPCRTRPNWRIVDTRELSEFDALQKRAPHSTVTGLALIALLPYLKDIPEVRLEGCVTEEQKKTFELIRREFNERTSNSRACDTADEPEKHSTAAWIQLVKPPDGRDFPSLEYLLQNARSNPVMSLHRMTPSLIRWENLSATWCGLPYFSLLRELRRYYAQVMLELSGATWFCDGVDCVSKPGYDHAKVFERNWLTFPR